MTAHELLLPARPRRSLALRALRYQIRSISACVVRTRSVLHLIRFSYFFSGDQSPPSTGGPCPDMHGGTSRRPRLVGPCTDLLRGDQSLPSAGGPCPDSARFEAQPSRNRGPALPQTKTQPPPQTRPSPHADEAQPSFLRGPALTLALQTPTVKKPSYRRGPALTRCFDVFRDLLSSIAPSLTDRDP